jgi:hypothetical protein
MPTHGLLLLRDPAYSAIITCSLCVCVCVRASYYETHLVITTTTTRQALGEM